MSEIIKTILKSRIKEGSYGILDAKTYPNVLKEELQYHVLNFIYQHSEYSKWIMYGGSALRIIHGLNRMSVDLDFEVPHPVTEPFLKKLKDEVIHYFVDNYGTEDEFLSIKINHGRGLTLKFNVGKELSPGQTSSWIHVKIDLNHFVAPKTVIERQPINHGQLSFVVITYNMSALMASKIVAILLRGTRGIGEAIYWEKGRDIYDLIWYMNNRAIPDLDYIEAKKADVKDIKNLFDKLTVKINKVSQKNLEDDLKPLFVDKKYIRHWLDNWRESYFHLLNGYKIRTLKNLEQIIVHQDNRNDNFSFIYWYNTEEGELVSIVYNISDRWFDFQKSDLPIEPDKALEGKIQFKNSDVIANLALEKKIKQYVILFYQKNQGYFKKTNGVMLGNTVVTKLIRMTADNFNQREQIVLNRSALLSCDLDDLLK